jgi:hypothetical protein
MSHCDLGRRIPVLFKTATLAMQNSTVSLTSQLVQYQTNILGSSTTVSNARSYYKNVLCSALVNGGKDRKTPHPFSYDIVLAGWGTSVGYSRSVAFGSYQTIRSNGPHVPPDFNVRTMQYTVPDWVRVENGAMAKIYDQLRGNNNLVVDLAEGGQTIKMVKSVLNLKKFILSFVRNVSRHDQAYDIRKLKSLSRIERQKLYRQTERRILSNTRNRKPLDQKTLDYVTGKWLEVRYGWQPLVYSIYDAADNINRKLRNETIYVKGRSGVRVNKTIIIEPSTSDRETLDGYVSSYRVEYGMLFNIPGGPKVSDWTSLNPVGIAYELMTLSFVIDWVADIGGYLSLWENNALFSKHFISGYKTRSYLEAYTHNKRVVRSQPWIYNPNGTPAQGFDSTAVYNGFLKRVGMNRTVITTLPTPPGVTIKVRFGTFHQLDALALLSQFGKSWR